MLTRRNPPTITPPLGAYAHAVEISANARWLHVSGQVGVRPDGSVPPDTQGQLEAAWDNIVAILADAGMGVEDVVKVTTYIVREEDFAVHPAVRKKYLQSNDAAATAVAVSALAKPQFLVEIEVIAARMALGGTGSK